MEPLTAAAVRARPRARLAPPAALAVLGVGAAVVYAFGLAQRYPLAAGIRLPRHTWAQVAGGATVPGLLLHVAVYTAAVLLYMAALHLLLRHTTEPGRAHRRTIAVIVGGWLLASLVLMAVTPGGESHDVFDYLFRGRMLVEAGGSPLADVPAHFVGLPYYQYLTWTDHVDTYGPLWEYASGATAAAAQGSLMALGRWSAGTPPCPAGAQSCLVLASYIIAYRVLAVALAGLCGWLIYRLVHSVDARLAAAALLAWLWNPLLLVATAVGAHNDMLMLFLLLASFWALQRRRWLLALLLLVLAGHVKLTALTLAPVYGFWLVRQLGWRRAVAYGAVTLPIGLAISWLLYAPLGGWATLPRMLEERQRYVALSFHHLLYRFLLARGVERELIWRLTIQWPTLIYLACSVVLASLLVGWRQAGREQGRAEDARSFWQAATAANLFYLLVGSFWFQTWYVLWVLAPAALLPASRFTRLVLPWLCWGVLCSNVVADYLPQLAQPPFTRTGRLFLAVMLVWAPAAVAAVTALAVMLRRQSRRKLTATPNC